jgi:hypothetical protein
MDIGSIFLLLALVVMVVFFVVITRPPGGARQLVSLLRVERARVIQALQELDFDYSLGKVPAEDYPVQRNALLLHGAEVLQQLDALQAQPPARETQDQLEAALAARRKDLSQATAPTAAPDPSEDLEMLIAARRRARNGSAPREKSIGFCPQCGKSLQKSDQFCPKCGTELK